MRKRECMGVEESMHGSEEQCVTRKGECMGVRENVHEEGRMHGSEGKCA